MWLPKEQRRLLAGYVFNVDEHSNYFDSKKIEQSISYEKTRLFALMEKSHPFKVHDYFDNDKPKEPENQDVQRFIRNKIALDHANKFLQHRGFIQIEKHQHDSNVIAVAVTLDGYDLGKRLLSWPGWCGVWYQEHKEGVIGAILSLFGGVVGGFLSHWVISHFLESASKGEP